MIVPAGNFLTGTIVLKNDVTLYLDPDAHIIGTADLNQYKSYQLTHEDPLEPINITIRDSVAWCKALVLLDHVHNVTITGTGTIDGMAVVNKKGEEGRRGPHGILIGDSKNIAISNIRVTRSGNYNILGLYVENIKITGITITEGLTGFISAKDRTWLLRIINFIQLRML